LNLRHIDHGAFVTYKAKGDHDRAIADFDEAIRLDPHDTLALKNRAELVAWQIDRFTAAIQSGKYAGDALAVACCDRASHTPTMANSTSR
jgi:tetratricopeptide (TPR) repeat protein